MFRAILAAGAIVLLTASGCAPSSTPAGPGTGSKVAVVTSFYPLQFVAERVGGDSVAVTMLTQPGAEPHDLELTSKQVASLSTAGLVIYQKGFQPAVDKAVAEQKPKHALDVTTVVPLHQKGRDHDSLPASPSTSTTHGDHDHDHKHEGADPHSWLDPTTVATYAKAVSQQLSQVDPGHAADYTKRAEALAAELNQLDKDFSTGLSSCQRKVFITSHEAFHYLAERYGLEQVAVAGLSPENEPSPARVAEVQKIAKEHGVTTIFYETLVSPKVSEALAKDLGLKTDVLDPVEGLTDQSRGTTYTEVMRANLTALRTANGCQ
ncbi:MAG: metal ABC transporter substrate-binding protein [Actinomycetia bacterium]|nr:metal ABC transporter substrate-binding protein [Actinomycetes bacterium]